MPRLFRSRRPRAAVALLPLLLPCVVAAQTAAPERPAVELSGLVFGGYQYHVEPGTNPVEDQQVRAGLEQNQFTLDRAYVTVRAAVAPRTSVRVTSDIYRAAGGYEMRLKYGYVDYRFMEHGPTNAFVRVGVVQNIMVEHEESFWPRWLSSAPLDHATFFSSADLGLAVGGTLPGGWGEYYAQVANGQGYQNVGRPDDRFKDWGARVTLRPFAALGGAPALRPFSISPWVYLSDTASVFGPNSTRADAPGYLGPVGAGRQRNRYGVFLGWNDPRRLAVGVSLAHRESELDTGANTSASPAGTRSLGEDLVAAYAVIRPMSFADSVATSPLALVLRYDRDDADTALPGRTHYVVAGLLYDVNRNLSFALDYQESLPERGQTATRSNTRQVYLAQFQAKF